MSSGDLVNENWSQLGGNGKPSIEVVDELADELVTEYDNPQFKQWYCGIIYDFGVSQVRLWRKRAMSADSPARLFSYYVKQARTGRLRKVPPTFSRESGVSQTLDDVQFPTDEELTSEGIEHELTEAVAELDKQTGQAIPWLKDDY